MKRSIATRKSGSKAAAHVPPAVALLFLAPLLGCSGDPKEGTAEGAGGDESSPVYVVSTCIDSADDSTGYAVLLDSLQSGDEPDLKNALEIPGCGVVSGPNRGGLFFVGDGESPIIRKYSVSNGEFREEGLMSLGGLGVSNGFYSQPHFVYLSKTKAYIISGGESAEIIVWNPELMEITGTIPLDGLERDGVYPAFSYAPQLLGEKLYVTARWRNDEGFRQENALIVVDTESDTLLSSTTDDRCADFLYAVRAPDDTLYFSNGNYASAFRLALGEETAPPACVLKVGPGELEFDPEFKLDLSALLGGREGGGLVPGANGSYFVQAFDGEVPAGTEWGDVFAIPSWRWWRVTENFEDARLVEALPASAAAFDGFAVDGEMYSTLATADYSETTFIAMGADDGVPRTGRTVPGWIAGALRLR
jgi:hypothetical protein